MALSLLSVLVTQSADAEEGTEPGQALPQAAELPLAILIRVDNEKAPEVLPFYRPVLPADVPDQGLLVWSEGRQEFWQACPIADTDQIEPRPLWVGSRGSAFGSGEYSQAGDAISMATIQIDQIRGLPRFKGMGFFITPVQQGRHLNPQITIRRQTQKTEPQYPAVTIELLRDWQRLCEFPLKEGQQKLRWRDIANLPESLANGLPAGEYVLRVKAGSEMSSFVIEDAEVREQVSSLPNALSKLLETNDDPLYLQIAAEHFLAQTDERGASRPYLADALDLLEDAPAAALTPFLNRLRNDILARFDTDPSSEDPAHVDDPTGIPAIDEARMLIAEGKWNEATAKLESPEALKTPRSQALSTLYQAVILAESAQAVEEEVRAGFRVAISQLANGEPEDAYRAHNNYANFLLCRAQDRLYNQAFEIASDVPNSLIHSLVHWREALEHYTKAGNLAEQLDEERQAAVRVNVARTYALLADIIRSLDAPVAGKRRFVAQEHAVHVNARNLAEKVIESDAEEVHSLTRAAAQEVLAHIAYREDDSNTCRQHAAESLAVYTANGSLPGIAGIHRVLGLLDLRSAATVESDAHTAKQREASLRHFQVAHFLSEFLRQRIAEDKVGLTRAGYLARHAYVNEQIIALLIDEGQETEALRYAELAKARGLQDVLAACDGTLRSDNLLTGAVDEILSKWPEKLIAIEYFLTANQCWMFVINDHGETHGLSLKAADGSLLASRQLINMVREARETLNNYKMLWQDEARAGHFDDSWQHQLHALYEILVPAEVRKELDHAERVIIVPHHILHYFPFAALVTKIDVEANASRMAQPRFLLDEPCDISYAPSLATWRRLAYKKVPVISRVGVVADTRSESNLREVATEVHAVNESFGDRVSVVHEGEQATTDHALRILRTTNLAFFGCHGQNVWDAPLEGHLLLSDDNLSARMLLDYDVSASVVVLSACHSGLADRSPLPGDDLFGLERVLLSRGANCVVSGNWLVDDLRGARITSAFMAALANGVSADKALADAQRHVVERYRSSSDERLKFFSHPHFWAVYKLTGAYRSPTGEPGVRQETSAPVSDAPEANAPVSSQGRPSETPPTATKSLDEFAAVSRYGNVHLRNLARHLPAWDLVRTASGTYCARSWCCAVTCFREDFDRKPVFVSDSLRTEHQELHGRAIPNPLACRKGGTHNSILVRLEL